MKIYNKINKISFYQAFPARKMRIYKMGFCNYLKIYAQTFYQDEIGKILYKLLKLFKITSYQGVTPTGG